MTLQPITAPRTLVIPPSRVTLTINLSLDDERAHQQHDLPDIEINGN
jgi:hypothetical protein